MRTPFLLRSVIPLVLAWLAVLFCLPPALAHDGGDFEITVQCTSLDRTLLGISIQHFAQDSVTVDRKDYLMIGLEGEGVVMREGSGYPLLPALYRSVMIPDSALMEVTVSKQEYTEYTGVDLLSNRGNILRTVDPATVPYTFNEIYEEDAWFPGDLAALREPYVLHDVRGVVVEVFPFQYNPVQKVLRVFTALEVEVKAAGEDTRNVIDRGFMPSRPDRSFHAIYTTHFINSGGGRADPPSEDGDMLIISHGPFMASMQPLVNWKNSIGISTSIVDVASIGNNSTAIKNHIAGVYGSSNLSYVLLVGDSVEVVSGSSGGGLSDAFYSLMTGDQYPDLFVGRFSANTTAHVDTQVKRTIEYEQQGHDLSMGGWNTWGMGVASDQGAGAGHYGEADNVHIGLIRTELLSYGFVKVDEIYDPYGTKSQVSAGLNEGRRAVNYCGHGSSTSWGSTGFSNTDVNNLTNVGMLPFICSVACVNGAFGSGTCFAEAWLRATSGGEPSGAVACYMSSVNQSWAPPMYAEGNHTKSGKYGAAERFWMEMNWSVGGCWYGGSCCMMDLAGSSGTSEFMNWIVFGDPSLRLTSMPALTMKLPDGVPEGSQFPGLANVITVEILNGKENYVPGTGTLHYRFDPSDPFTPVTVTPLGGDLYEAVLPNTQPGDEPEFYLSAQGDGGTTLFKPAGAPAECYAFDVYFEKQLFRDNFESDKGWTIESINLTDGEWERGKPAGDGTRGDPTQDADGSGKCYLTDNVAGNSDVDGGPTRVISPLIDLSSGDAEITYYRWHYNDDNDDWFQVELSNDGGGTWQLVEQVMHTDGWNYHEFKVADFLAPTAQMKVRFSATDNPNNSVTEAGLDAFTVRRIIWDASLWADAYNLSAAAGGAVNLTLDAGGGNANRPYLVLGSITGTQPGFMLPGGMPVPLNWDALTNLILSTLGSPVFQNFMGTLDGAGGASAVFNTLGPVDPVLVGQTLSFAYLLNPPPGWDFVSNAIPITFDP